MAKTVKVRIGISGWTYTPWRGVFYPQNLPHKQELNYAAARFQSIEINGTFYRLQRPESFDRWRESAPADADALARRLGVAQKPLGVEPKSE